MNLSDALATAFAERFGLDGEDAQQMAEDVITWGAANGLAGTEHYWPCKFAALSKGERDAAIRREFNGRNLRDVCAKFGVSHTTVYRAIHHKDDPAPPEPSEPQQMVAELKHAA